MGGWFSKPKAPPPPDTSAIEAVERRQAEQEKSQKRSIKARQRAASRGGPLRAAMQSFQTRPSETLGTTLGPRQRPT